MSKHGRNLAVVEDVNDEPQGETTTDTTASDTTVSSSSEEPNLVVPDFNTVGATPEEIAAQVTQKQLRSGFCYLFHPIREELTVAKESKSLMMKLTLAPCVNIAGDLPKPKRPTLIHNIVFPFVNPSAPGHAGPETWDMCAEYLAAEDENFPKLPRKIQGSKPTKYELRNGQVIDAKDYGAIKKQVIEAVNTRLKQRGLQYQTTGRSDFLSGYVYGLVRATTQKAGQYAGRTNLNVVKFSAKPVEGSPYLTDAKEFGEEVKNNG